MAGPGTFKWGSVNIKARNVVVEDLPRQAPRLAEGFTGSADRLDVRSYEVQSLHLGLGVHIGTGEETDSKRYKVSEGLWAHQIGKLVMPPALVEQANLIAADFSGYRAARKDVVCARSTLGGSSPVNYYGVGPYLFREDSSGVLSLAHTFTNNITDMGDVYANNTRYFGVVTDGTTDDAVVTTDPTAGSISWATWFALASGDRIDWFVSLREVGNGFTLMAGKIGSATGFFYLSHASALATAPSAAVNFQTKDILGDQPVQSVTAVPTVLKQISIDAGVGNNRWKSDAASTDAVPADVATSGDSLWAESSDVPAVTGHVSTTLIALGYDFSDVWQYGSALINGIKYSPRLDREGQIIYDFGVYIYTLSQQSFAPNLGLTQETGQDWPSTFTTRDYGDATTLHGRPWSLEDLKILQVDHSIEVAGDGANSVAMIDNMPVTVYYQLPGTQQRINAGSEFIGRDPVIAGRFWVIEPEHDDPTGRMVPRRLVRVDIDHDAGGLRPTVEMTPQTNLPCFPYVIAGAMGENSMFLALGNDKDLARHLIRIPFNSLIPEDVEWSRDQGFTEDWGIVNLFAMGADCILECATGAATVAQDFIYESHSNSVHAYGPRQTITALPLHMVKARVSAYSHMRHRFVPQTDLSSGLLGYWPLTEASGNALDISGNARHLTETSGTIGAAAGHFGGTARDLELADSESFVRADEAWQQPATIAGWFQAESHAADGAIVAKFAIGGDQRSFMVFQNDAEPELRFEVSSLGTAASTTQVQENTVLVDGTWYFFIARHRNGQNIGIRLNANAEVTAAHVGGMFDSTATFNIGAWEAQGLPFDGRVQHIAAWDVVLTDAQADSLYNSGSGRTVLGLSVARQYTPDTPHLDPFANLASVTKQDGPLLITLPELPMMGPPEGRNALLTARIGSRQVSATKTVALYYSLDGGANWTLWTTFTAYGGVATLSPPVSASTVALRLALNNAGASADTPSGLPVTIFGDSDFAPRRRWSVEVDETWLFQEQGGAGGVEKLWDTLSAVTPHLQTVTQDGQTQNQAKWNRFRSGNVPATRSTAAAEPLADPENMRHVLVFDEVAV